MNRKVPLYDLRQCARDGLSQSETARKYGLSVSYVSALAAEFNIKFKPGHHGRTGLCTPEMIDRLKRLAAEGCTVAAASEKTGVAYETLRRWTLQHCIEFARRRAKKQPAHKRAKDAPAPKPKKFRPPDDLAVEYREAARMYGPAKAEQIVRDLMREAEAA